MDRGEPTLAPEWLKATGTPLHSGKNAVFVLLLLFV